MTDHLVQFGWDRDLPHGVDASSLGRVVAPHGEAFVVQIADKCVWGELSGPLRARLDSPEQRPTVGDWVALGEPYDGGRNLQSALLLDVLPRRGLIARERSMGRGAQVLAANVDVALIVTSANKDLNIGRLHRYVLTARQFDVRPVIVLNKLDLVDNIETLLAATRLELPGVSALSTTVMNDGGLKDLIGVLGSGKTAVLIGSSGVGKSSLVNALLGREAQSVKEIRNDDKGRHTTSAGALFVLDSGALLIDTPGLRELRVLADARGMAKVFGDVDAFGQGCKFSDCTHTEEPGCAVVVALAAGELGKAHYAQYLKLRAELAQQKRVIDPQLAGGKKRRSRALVKPTKRHSKRPR